jgi:hypothetical protein
MIMEKGMEKRVPDVVRKERFTQSQLNTASAQAKILGCKSSLWRRSFMPALMRAFNGKNCVMLGLAHSCHTE